MADLRMAELLERVAAGAVREVLLATNATVKGQTTAFYVTEQLKPTGVRMTRLAFAGATRGGTGLPGRWHANHRHPSAQQVFSGYNFDTHIVYQFWQNGFESG
jgi:hypothetical protein